MLPWTISAGALSVDGTIANSTMTVNAGGTLGGSGTVGTTVVNGGTLAPGSTGGGIFGADNSAHQHAAQAGERFDRDLFHRGDIADVCVDIVGPEALTTGSTVEDVLAWPARIRAVTADAVRDAARTWLDRRRSVTGYLVKELPKTGEKRS